MKANEAAINRNKEGKISPGTNDRSSQDFSAFVRAPSSPAFGWAIDISLAARFLVYHPSSNTWRHIQRRESLESVGEGDAFQKRRSNRVWGCCLNLSPRSPMWPIASLFETCRHERERERHLPYPSSPPNSRECLLISADIAVVSAPGKHRSSIVHRLRRALPGKLCRYRSSSRGQ